MITKTITMDEVVFENRNQQYGAYELRQRYERHVNTAILISMSAFLLMVSIPTLVRLLKGSEPVVKVTRTISGPVILQPPPIHDKIIVPPTLPPPPTRRITQFVPPTVTFEPVPDSETMPTMEELRNVETGAVEVEGTDVVFDVPDQVTQAVVEEKPDNTVYISVEQMPAFPGGQEALMKYLGTHTKYPPQAMRTETQGTVFVSFVVSRNGSIEEVSVVKGLSKECDEEAVRVIQSMPVWTPGKQNGRTVLVKFVLPIRFRID